MKEWLLKNWGRQRRDCYYACTKVLKFITDEDVPANIGISKRPHKNIDGYRYINIFVWFTQKEADEPPVDPGVVFAFSTGGETGARRYANLDENLPGRLRVLTSSKSQGVLQGMVVNGRISSYVARFPVMGPYVQVFVYNRACRKEKSQRLGLPGILDKHSAQKTLVRTSLIVNPNWGIGASPFALTGT